MADLCWGIGGVSTWDDYRGLILAMESEIWDGVEGILYDASKLVDIKAEYKVVVCVPPKKEIDKKNSRILKTLKLLCDNHLHVDINEKWLVIMLSWNRHDYEVSYFGFSWKPRHPVVEIKEV